MPKIVNVFTPIATFMTIWLKTCCIFLEFDSITQVVKAKLIAKISFCSGIKPSSNSVDLSWHALSAQSMEV